jgi:uncharacterized protein (TIGR04551 family)
MRASAHAVLIAAWLAAGPARASDLATLGDRLTPHTGTEFAATGALRLRAALLDDLDLDRGPTPSGAPIFPLPLTGGHLLTENDERFRLDLGVYPAGGTVGVVTRVDLADNVPLGGNVNHSSTLAVQSPPSNQVFRLVRAYGVASTPVGLLAAGRMGNDVGLGMLANGGDCADCDSEDSSDRIAFVTPMVGHLWALAYDFAGSGPFFDSRDGTRPISLDPSMNTQALTMAVLRYTSSLSRKRRLAARRATTEYGLYGTYAWQANDVPASYLPLAAPVPISSSQVMSRGLGVTATDVWFRFTAPKVRIEGEGAVILGHIDQPSTIPGITIQHAVTLTQYGAAVQSDFFGDPDDPFSAGLDAGVASGDSAPGFGAFPSVNSAPPQPGDLDGSQANLRNDFTINNFRFHPDYRVDLILFREIIGTVTDAAYLRPHVRQDLYRTHNGRLTASLAGIASTALYASSTPGGKAPLGIEFDPTVSYRASDGFVLALDQGTLFPLSGFDNSTLGLRAKPAQLWRLRFIYGF